MDHRSEFLKGQDRIALSSHTGSTPPIARLAGAASGETTVTPFCPLSPILQSERQVVTNPAVHHGTDLLLVTFSFVLLFAPLFRGFRGKPTQFHRIPCYVLSISFHFLLFIVLLQLADGKLLRTCSVVRLELHIADEKASHGTFCKPSSRK